MNATGPPWGCDAVVTRTRCSPDLPAPAPEIGALVRNDGADAGGMTNKLLATVVARTAGRFDRKHSDAYRWLLARHGELAAAFAGHPPCWPDMAATLAAAGVLGGRSRPLTGQAVRRIWGRVRRDVQAAARLQAPGMRPHAGTKPPIPSSVSPSWRPTPTSPPGWQPKPTLSGRVFESPEAEAAAEADAEEQLARLRRHIDERSGRRRPDPPAAVPAAPSPAASSNPLNLPKEGGPLTPEQVEAMMADVQRTLDERSGRLPPSR